MVAYCIRFAVHMTVLSPVLARALLLLLPFPACKQLRLPLKSAEKTQEL